MCNPTVGLKKQPNVFYCVTLKMTNTQYVRFIVMNGHEHTLYKVSCSSVLWLSLTSLSAHHLYFLIFFQSLQALPPGAMQQLPKRPTLEKTNGAAAVFNPSMFHYQQALASMQLQQPAFIPTGEFTQTDDSPLSCALISPYSCNSLACIHTAL